MFRTIKSEITFEGIGLHSGSRTEILLYPSEKEGIYFKTSNGLFPLTSAVVVEDKRLTGFSLPDGTIIRTAEHILGTLVAMHIDGIIVNVKGGEVPILDGSAYPFASAVSEAVVETAGETKPERFVIAPVFIEETEPGRIIAAVPSDRLKVTYVIDYANTPVGTQRVIYDITPDIFLNTISKARTFGLMSELDYLNKAGLAKGGSLDNALIFDENGLINQGGLRFSLECVTHKVIDLLGDLAFLGKVPIAHYVAICAGHNTHGRLVNRLKRIFPNNQGNK